MHYFKSNKSGAKICLVCWRTANSIEEVQSLVKFLVPMKASYLLILIIAAVVTANSSDYINLCRLFKINTKLRLPGSCDQYIVCNGSSGQLLVCEENSKYDAKQQKCVKNFDATHLCDNRCVNSKDGTFVANPTDCRSFYYCEKGICLASSCEIPYYFDQDKQMCVYPSNSQCIQDVNNICELVADNTAFRNENDCSKYYTCERDKLKKINCKDQYFNVETGKCVEKSSITCAAHHATSNTCLKKKKPFVGERSDGATCRGYFVCTDKGLYAHDLEPVWLQCPAGTFFDENLQECLPALDVKCDYNRCEGRGSRKVVSGKNNCRNYLECHNNVILKEETCAYHYFFDERIESCVHYVVYDKACDDENTHTKK